VTADVTRDNLGGGGGVLNGQGSLLIRRLGRRARERVSDYQPQMNFPRPLVNCWIIYIEKDMERGNNKTNTVASNTRLTIISNIEEIS
jgi:hypothetical protein